jgi:catechol 2,3-dioxygenase-like lactoylglutathione lyase family enzyme
MKINHLIVGAKDVTKSVLFYCQLFGFEKTLDDPGMVGGQVLHGHQSDLLLLPFNVERLPNPAHFAFEATRIEEFENLLQKAKDLGLEPRSAPSKNSELGFGIFKRGSTHFKNFYISDPSGVNVEVMVFVKH